MSDSTVRIGLDGLSLLVYAARVTDSSGRPQVEGLTRLDPAQLDSSDFLFEGERIWSLRDDRAIIKNLQVDPTLGIDLHRKAVFEMSQSLFEDDQSYLFDSIATGREGRVIGIAVNRDLLPAPAISRDEKRGDVAPSSKFMVRAAALGYGYLNYCLKEKGELVCLADFAGQIVSICFVHRDSIIGLAHLPSNGLQPDDRQALKNLALEFKTVLNFKLAGFFDEGITFPISALLVSGEMATRQTKAALSDHFSVDIVPPRLNPGFFANSPDETETPLENYLVSLGLTAD